MQSNKVGSLKPGRQSEGGKNRGDLLYGLADGKNYEVDSALREGRIATASHWEDEERSRDKTITARSGAVVEVARCGCNGLEERGWNRPRAATGQKKLFTKGVRQRRVTLGQEVNITK